MCKFISAIVLKNGQILCHPELTDSHSDLLRAYRIKDETADPEKMQFARIEFTPEDDPCRLDGWKLNVDQMITPFWFDHDLVDKQMRERVRSMIITFGVHDLVIGGCLIIGGSARIDEIIGGRIYSIGDYAKVGRICGSTYVRSIKGFAEIGTINDSVRVNYISGRANVRHISGFVRFDPSTGHVDIGHITNNVWIDSISGPVKIGCISSSVKVGRVGSEVTIREDLRS